MITAELLLRQPWRFSRSLGQIIYPELHFLPNGGLQPYSSSEARWVLADGILEFRDDAGMPTTRFHRHQLLTGGDTRLTGKFLLRPELFLYHFLDTAGATAPPKESRLNVSMSLSGESDTLLVIFNSAGGPSEGADSRWEFFHLPDELGLDHVRFAEMRSPTVFYLDKTKSISSTLSTVLKQGYRRVLITGMSSGGYIGMLIAELICNDFPHTEFLTFAINPQTTQLPQQTFALAMSAPAGMAPMLLDEFAFALRDCEETSIAEVARSNPNRRANVHHTIFYDSDNPVEVGYATLMKELSGVIFHPQALGLSHFESCVTMFNSRLAHDAIAAAINFPLPH